jgi:hypothetical protein
MTQVVERCENCGAPEREGLACCEYCDVPIAGRVLGIRCPSCSEVAVPEARACPVCNQSFTKGCVFCGQVAFLTAGSCPRCHEAFEGAEQRKKQREEQQRQQQMMGMAATGVSVLAPIVGQAISSQIGGSGGFGGKSGGGAMASLFDMIIKSNDKKR